MQVSTIEYSNGGRMQKGEGPRERTLKIACAISHVDEPTLPLCMSSVAAQTYPCMRPHLVAGLTPMCESFNAALDFASDVRADFLFHTASDVVAEPWALGTLVQGMNTGKHYLSVGTGTDILNGPGTRCGLWLFNMRIIGRRFRFRDVFKQDLDFCHRVEEDTGCTRVYPERARLLGYHQPIATARHLYSRLLYSSHKYTPARRAEWHAFLEAERYWNPSNKVLIAGIRALDRAGTSPPPDGSKNSGESEALFAQDTADLALTGTEYYIYNVRFKEAARQLLGSLDDCVAVEERGDQAGIPVGGAA